MMMKFIVIALVSLLPLILAQDCNYNGMNYNIGDLYATGKLGSYTVNLCQPVSNCTGLNNVAVCQQQTGADPFHSIGDFGQGSWSMANGNPTYSDTVTENPCKSEETNEPVPRISKTSFVCDETATRPMMTVDDQTDIKLSGLTPPYLCTWLITINTKNACAASGGGGGDGKKGLSGGWIFIIVLIVLTFVYLVGGVLYLRFHKGATGTDMCPNKEFWKDLPSLVKDGFVYVFSKCRGNKGGDSYSNI